MQRPCVSLACALCILVIRTISAFAQEPPLLDAVQEFASATTSNGKVVFAGGLITSIGPSRAANIYDSGTGLWTSKANALSNLGRWAHAAASCGNTVIFAGSASVAESNTVDFYDASTDTWTSTSTGRGSLSVGRSYLAGASANGKIVFAGGRNSSLNAVSTVDIYDCSGGTWTSTASGVGELSVARSQLGAAASGNFIVFAGGNDGSGNPYKSTVDIYNAATGEWNSTATGAGSLSVARYSSATASSGSKVIFSGGCGFNNPAGRVVDIFDVDTGIWTTAMLSISRCILAAAAFDNLVLIGGGTSPVAPPYSSVVDFYDVATGVMNSAGPGALSQARIYLVASAANKKFVFAGGQNGSSLNTVDIYDATTGTWTTSTPASPTPSPTPSLTPTLSPTPILTPTPSPTTPSLTPSATPSNTPSQTPSLTPSPSPSPTAIDPTASPSPTPTYAPTPSPAFATSAVTPLTTISATSDLSVSTTGTAVPSAPSPTASFAERFSNYSLLFAVVALSITAV